MLTARMAPDSLVTVETGLRVWAVGIHASCTQIALGDAARQ